MTSKHTPGPWRMVPVNTSPRSHVMISGAVDPVCIAPDHVGNALLIAAAPELAEALVGALRSLEAHLTDAAVEHGVKQASGLCPCWDNEVQAARAALRKAGVLPETTP